MRLGYIANLWLIPYIIYELLPYPESVKFSIRYRYFCWYFTSARRNFATLWRFLRPRQNFAGVKKKKSTFYRYYPYMCIFPIPKFHKTSYSLYGLATRILDLEEMVIKACSVALCLETILRFYSSLGEGFLIIKYTLDLLQCIKQWGQL